MDDQRVGRVLRAIRHRLAKRQQDVGEIAGVSQDVVSRVERGRLRALQVGTLRAIAAAMDAELVISLRWRGADLDRLLDEGHAALAGRVTMLLEELGWEVRPEVSYSVFGERGSIDLLAWHAPTRTLLVIEIKTDLASIEATLRKLDEKVRLAPRVAAERFGWEPRAVAFLLVLPDASTPRRQVRRHDAVLAKVFTLRGSMMRQWLSAPAGGMGGLMFLSVTRGGRARPGPVSRRRIRLSAAERAEREEATLTRANGANDAPGA